MHFLFLITSLLFKPHLDTIDNWQIYQNKRLLGSYTQNSNNPQIMIKRSLIKHGDIIKIAYFRDTPCDNCATSLYIKKANGIQFKLLKGKGTFAPFILPVEELINNPVNETYSFYRSEDGRDEMRLLFKLIIK